MSFTEHLAKRALAQKGKSAEAEVKGYLEKVHAGVLRFDWHRAYDARSAGGKFQRIAGDFSFYSPTGHGLIEVKETKQDHRLPYKNFEFSKVAMCAKRKEAGGQIIVAIYSSDTDRWRLRPIDYFQHRDDKVGSWGLSEDGASPDLYALLNAEMAPHLQGFVPKP